MPAPNRIPKTRLLLFGLVPLLLLALAAFSALTVEYLALGQPRLDFFALNLVSGCQNKRCQLGLEPKSLVEPHTSERYSQLTGLINRVGWQWSVPLGPVTLESEFKYDVPDYEVLVHGGYIHVDGPSLGVAYTSNAPAAPASMHSLFTLDKRGDAGNP